MALSATQDADVQEAIRRSANARTGDEAEGDISSYLGSLGDFSPEQLASLSTDGIEGSGQFTGAQPNQTWGSQVENSLGSITPASTAPGAQPPTGLPTPDQATQTAPVSIQSFGATPTVTPSYASSTGYNAATIDPNKQYGYLQAEEAANSASLQPTFQNQDQANEDQLKARGISSSGAGAEITNQLYGQQAATLAGMNAPAIQQQSGYTQQDLTGNQTATNAARQYDATNDQNTNIFNAGEGTAASGANAGYYAADRSGDATAYNGYLNTLNGEGYNTSNEAYTAYLNSFGPNSGVTSGYNGTVGGIGNTYGNVYSSGNAAQAAEIGGAFGAAGQAVK